MSLVAIVALVVVALIGLALAAVLDSIVSERRAARRERSRVAYLPQRAVSVPRSLAPRGQKSV
jgi:type II secretory pathway component PulJ